MADGTTRDACKNTYEITEFPVDGSVKVTRETRVEFRLFRNVNARGPAFRKTTPKQASTFQAQG